jgi:glutamyl-tRNA reductase
MNQTPEAEKPSPYRRPAKRDCLVVTTWLDDAAAAAMRQVMKDHNLSRSGAVHHMVRVAAGLPSFLP